MLLGLHAYLWAADRNPLGLVDGSVVVFFPASKTWHIPGDKGGPFSWFCWVSENDTAGLPVSPDCQCPSSWRLILGNILLLYIFILEYPICLLKLDFGKFWRWFPLTTMMQKCVGAHQGHLPSGWKPLRLNDEAAWFGDTTTVVVSLGDSNIHSECFYTCLL